MEQSARHVSLPAASLRGASAGGESGATQAVGEPRSDDERAFAAVVASVERLDALGLVNDAGLAVVEPATTFRSD